MKLTIRSLDILLSSVGLIILSLPLVIIFIICLLETNSPIFVQNRLGKNQKIFKIFKFRTMHIGTAQLGTHLVSADQITKFGRFLRVYKLDELPQLVNVLVGQMSLVGPRPNMPSQIDLTNWRQKYDVYTVRPGITGIAQIKNIDMRMPKKLAKVDSIMIKRFSIKIYFSVLYYTVTNIR